MTFSGSFAVTRPARRLGASGLALWAAVLLQFATIAGFAQQKTAAGPADGGWETLAGCELLTNAVVDGDSFHVRHGGREYIFRLYFVDAPETNPALKERVEDQAAYFGISPELVPTAGKLAAMFTRARLRDTNFTVFTRWQNAMGRSSLARFYCVVAVGGENLAQLLVSQGLARIHGLRANWPGNRSTTFINRLKHDELEAREKQLGVWNTAHFPRDDNALPAPTANTTEAETKSAPAATNKVDLNTAAVTELDSLPGIGPALAKRIVEHRPFQSVDELDRVPGIGKKTLERLRLLVQTGSTAAAPAESPDPK